MASRRKSSSRKLRLRDGSYRESSAVDDTNVENGAGSATANIEGSRRRFLPRSKGFLILAVALLAAMGILATGLILNRLAPMEPARAFLTADGPLKAVPAKTDNAAFEKERPETLSFVGSDTCISCHKDQGKAWHPSQHAHAMAHASEETVLADFNDTSFTYFGTTTRFFRRNGKFYVETDGEDGKLETFEVKYTFGLEPLQQYLIAFPDGRVQALTIAWDSRPKAQGGQRWFHLYPDEHIGHDDPLHWTKLNQNWNFMCAECHSTGVAKNYDPATKRYNTTWKEITVGCEACHGEGSSHVAWARTGDTETDTDPALGLLARFDERSGVSWRINDETGQPERSLTPSNQRREVEMCGRCHGRRGMISETFVPGAPLSDSHRVALLARGLYQADGQMLDEVYNYGSFKQSKMFAKGVTCSDCHDPHSAKLKVAGAGVCLQCHAGTYAEESHSHHQGVDAPNCISCHMPSREFMVIDTRHDHAFRVPRPDLSVTLGIDNACTDCHQGKSAKWAARAIEEWYGPGRKGFQTFAPAFHGAWTGSPDAAALLSAVAADNETPAIARASALAELTAYPSRQTADLVRAGLSDPDPMVRLAALDHLETASGAQLWPLIGQLLDDPVRGVRTRAGFLLAGTPEASLSAGERTRLAAAEKEFVAAEMLNADRPESQSLLARYYIRKGTLDRAEAALKTALELSPHFTPAAVNLADLYRSQGRDDEGAVVLRDALQLSPNDGGLHHALGLLLVRLKQPGEAVEALGRAATLEPDRVRYAYVHAVGLESIGKRDEAIAALQAALARHPQDRDVLTALVNFSRADGDLKAALSYARELAVADPGNPNIKQLIEALTKQVMEQQDGP